MMKDLNKGNILYEVVNENDEIIGLAERDKILREDLLRRIIHVWFFTPKGELIFQHRAPGQRMFPDLLDATVGGKVERGESFEETALKETEEETGLVLRIEDLIPVAKFRIDFMDETSNFRNSIFTQQYIYCYRGDVKDLRIEEEKILGFEAIPIDKLFNLTEEEKKRFIMPALSSPEFLILINKIRILLANA